MKNSFVQEALKKVGSPQVLVNVVSKRVRQLGQGFRPLIEVNPRWTFMDIALKEIADGKLAVEVLSDSQEPSKEAAPAKKSRKKAA